MSDLYLYHATDRKNLESIKQNGLLVNPPDHNWKDMYCNGKIFLALSAEVADDYANSSDNPPENIVILKVKLDALNDNCFDYDWNNRCEYRQDINSCIYKSDIPGDLLQECNPANEPYQEFDDFERTELYNILYDVFWEEVETNLERED